MEYWWIVFVATAIIIFFVMAPFTIFYFWRFWTWRHIDIISKRRPKLVIAFSLVTLINILIIRTYFAILSNLTYSQIHLGILNDARIRTPAIWFTQLTANLILFRVWIVFYDWRRNVYILQLKWEKQLLSTQDQHWTLKYGHILGNEKLLIIISIIHYIGGVILCLIAIEISGGENALYYDLIIGCDGLIIAIPFCVLSFVSQKFHDSIGIRDEIRGVAIIFIMGVFLLVTGAVLTSEGFHVDPLYNTIVRSQGSYALSAVVSLCVVFRLVYVKRLEMYLNNDTNDPNKLGQTIRLRALSVKKADKTVNFADVLSSEEGFKVFANHLLKEYSVETLLFLLELTQIKTAIIKHYRDLFATHHSQQYSFLQTDIEKAIGAMTFKINIAPQIVRVSDTVYKDISINKVIKLWKYLYDQYINEHSNSAINISHAVRLSILDSLNQHNLLERTMSVIFIDKTKKGRNKRMVVPSTQMKTIPSLSVMVNDVSESAVTPKASSDIDIPSMSVENSNVKLESHGTVMELIAAFDLAAKEIYHLLETDSWQRFRVSDEFLIWKQQFFDPPRKFTLA